MAVNVERLEGLKCRVEITLPANDIQVDINQRLKDIAPKVKLKGFRPGQVPMTELQRRYGKEVRDEVVNERVFKALQDTLEEQDIRPAGYPSLEQLTSDSKDTIRCAATFEVFPEFKVKTLSGVKLEKVGSEISDADIDEMLEQLRIQHMDWHPVDRPSKEGDQLIIDFAGKVHDKPLERGSAKGYSIILGEKSMIPGFEDGLIGKKVGEQFTMDLKFPDDYFEKKVAGTPVSFDVIVQKVSEPELPEINDAFAEKLKVKDGIEGLKNDIRKNLEREVKFRSKNIIKQKLVDKLLEINEFDIPNALVDQEVQTMIEDMKQRTGQEFPPEFDRSEFEQHARRRVRTGLIFSEIIKQNDLKPNDELIDARLQEMAESFDNPEQVINVYKSNERLLESIKNEIMEDMVVNKLLDEASVAEKKLSFKEFKEFSEKDGE